MTTQLDFSVGLAKETTYGTPVTPTRFVESEAKLKYEIKTAQGRGLRPGKNVHRLNRHQAVHFEGSGDIDIDVPTRGFGFLLNALFGQVVNTLVPTTTPPLYQQNHVLQNASDPVQSFTVQEILPTLGGVNSHPHTFTGCVFDSMELSAKEGSILEAKFSLVARELQTSVAAAATSYPADDALFTFVHGAISLGGTLTEPDATTIASLSGSPAANIADFSLSVKRNLDGDGWNLGGAGLRSRAPLYGVPELSGKITAEYTDNVLRDAYLQQSALALVLTFQHNVAVSGAHKPTLQVVLPAIRLNGEVPTSDGGKAIKQSIDFEAFDNGIATQPIWVIYRTLDATP
ncbi:phage tail tube protein [Microbacterium maritypicum]|uniref:phage tail tube protein n=1 Tax=Microbacterium maritypicum TaxID=33918 RepID=UPI003813023B